MLLLSLLKKKKKGHVEDESSKESSYNSEEEGIDYSYSDIELLVQIMQLDIGEAESNVSEGHVDFTDLPHTQQGSGGGRNFTFDDITFEKLQEWLQEFHAWLTTKHLTVESKYDVMTEFVSRFMGSLKD